MSRFSSPVTIFLMQFYSPRWPQFLTDTVKDFVRPWFLIDFSGIRNYTQQLILMCCKIYWLLGVSVAMETANLHITSCTTYHIDNLKPLLYFQASQRVSRTERPSTSAPTPSRATGSTPSQSATCCRTRSQPAGRCTHQNRK